MWENIVLSVAAGMLVFFGYHLFLRVAGRITGERWSEDADAWRIGYISAFVSAALLIIMLNLVR